MFLIPKLYVPTFFNCHSVDRVSSLLDILSPSTEPENIKWTQRKMHSEVQVAVGHLLKISTFMAPRVCALTWPNFVGSWVSCYVTASVRDKSRSAGPPHRSHQNTAMSSPSTYKARLTHQCQRVTRTARLLHDFLVGLALHKRYRSLERRVPVFTYHWRHRSFCLPSQVFV